MTFNKSIWPKRSFFGPMALFYLITIFIYGVMQQSKVPAAPILMMQIAAVFITYFFSFLYSKKSIFVTCLIIFFFQLITAYGLRYFNIEYFHHPLGYNPADALLYHEIASRFYRYPVHDFTLFMDQLDFMLDDRGMNYITYFVYKFGGSPENGLFLSVLLNVSAITVSVFYIFKLCRNFVDVKYAQFAAFVWGTQLYSSYTSSVGLKENYMVLFIVISLYFIAKLNNDFTWKNVTLAVFWAAFALFFRMALFYMLLASILFVIGMKYPLLRRYMYALMIFAIFLTWYYFRRTFDEMSVLRSGTDAMDYETYQGLVQGKMERTGAFASIVSYLSSLIGPLPNLVASGEKVNYITLYGFSSFCKSFYAFYFIYGIYCAIKTKRADVIGLLVFWFLDVVMLIMTFYTLHDRYHWPHVPIVIALSVWGAVQLKHNKSVKWLHRCYFIIVFIIITVFNFR